MMLSINQFNVGDVLRIRSMQGLAKPYRHQLATMGLKKEKIIMIKQIAPLGDPICIEIDGALLAIRRAECEEIFVERI